MIQVSEIKRYFEDANINIQRPGQILDYVDTREHLFDLFNYITKLEQENKLLKKTKLAKQFPNTHCVKIKINTYKDRIDKAIEHLHKRNEQNKSALTNKEETIISKHELLKLENINNEILEDILRGKDE